MPHDTYRRPSSGDPFSMEPVPNLGPGLSVDVINTGGRCVEDLLAQRDPVLGPLGVLEPRKTLVEPVLIPEIAANSRIRVVDEHVVVVHLERLGREHSLEITGFGEPGDRMPTLSSEDHRGLRLT